MTGKTLVISLLPAILIINIASAAENYLYVRQGVEKNGDNYSPSTYIVFENKKLGVSLGGRIIISGSEYKYTEGSCFVPFGQHGLQGGIRFSSDSNGTELFTTAVRFLGPVSKFFVYTEAGQYFDPKDKKHRTNLYFSFFTSKRGWGWGSEVKYAAQRGDYKQVAFRPLRLGYRWQNNLLAFAMIQYSWRWEEDGLEGHPTLFVGIEHNF